MKYQLLYGLSIMFASACGSNASHQNQQSTTQDSSAVTETVVQETTPDVQETERTENSKIQNGILLGQIEKSDFLTAPFASWFKPSFDAYKPGAAEIEIIKSQLTDVDKIRVYMGTWCSDSQREVPHFFKILEAANYDLDKVEMIAVNHSKAAPDGSHETYKIQYVPSFVFYKDGEEIGRFVEYPRETLEKDVAKIVSGQEYKHSHES